VRAEEDVIFNDYAVGTGSSKLAAIIDRIAITKFAKRIHQANALRV